MNISDIFPSVFSKKTLIEKLPILKSEKFIPQSFNLEDFLKSPHFDKHFDTAIIKGKTDQIERFVNGKFTFIELGFSLLNHSWISHYSALEIHQLANKDTTDLFITQELTRKEYNSLNKISQDAVDAAFGKSQRTLNQIFKFKNHRYYLLKTKFSNRLGVINLIYNNVEISVTNIERTLIDCVVRPAYSGDVNTIIEVFSNARGKLDVTKMYDYLVQLDYIYPYHQAIGFLLEHTGYSAKDWSLFDLKPKHINFYLTYNIKNKYLNRRWMVYIPEDLVR